MVFFRVANFLTILNMSGLSDFFWVLGVWVRKTVGLAWTGFRKLHFGLGRVWKIATRRPETFSLYWKNRAKKSLYSKINKKFSTAALSLKFIIEKKSIIVNVDGDNTSNIFWKCKKTFHSWKIVRMKKILGKSYNLFCRVASKNFHTKLLRIYYSPSVSTKYKRLYDPETHKDGRERNMSNSKERLITAGNTGWMPYWNRKILWNIVKKIWK